MATQSLPHVGAHPAFHSATGGNWQTMTTGAGNGSVANYHNAKLLVIWNDAIGSTAVVTFKSANNQALADRSGTVGDWTRNVQNNTFIIVPVPSIMADGGSITVECDQAVKIACIKEWPNH